MKFDDKKQFEFSGTQDPALVVDHKIELLEVLEKFQAPTSLAVLFCCTTTTGRGKDCKN